MCRDPHRQAEGRRREYTIDPDGPKPVYDSFDVTCNMTTKGGGWTGISRCTAQKELRGRIKTVVSGSSVGIDKQCRPHARDRNGSHNYLYTFDFPGGFSEFYLKNFAVEADAHGFRDTSELNQGKEYGTWTQKNPVPNDIAFGSGAFAKPTTSYVRQLSKKKECKSCTIPWPADGKIFKMKSRANSFRIGFAEGGGQDEGWIVWTKGMIYVR
ncbi:MAG: fibrinogen-like YCDxxxxGGGW domain-containing protein [Bradymonadaceae bacterium]